MSDISKYLTDIMQAIYGKDVRQSIHDAIKTIDEVADTAQNSATKMANTALDAASAAEQSKMDAEGYSAAAAASKQAAGISEDNAAKYAESARKSEVAANNASVNAAASEQVTTQKAEEASASAVAAKESEQAAKLAEQMAEGYSNTAADKSAEADVSAKMAEIKANSAAAASIAAESYAHGGTGTRDGEDVDNARYYKEQAERISQGLAGGLMPMGTVTFEMLSEQTKNPGYMYNISDTFTTTEEFKEGAGHEYAPGTNVYWTADGYWDCIAGTSVAGVKGDAESTYQTGFVNITPSGIGLGNIDNTSDTDKPISQAQQQALDNKVGITDDTAENTVSFDSGDMLNPTGWADVELLTSGEKHKGLLCKISSAIKNVRYLYKLIGNTDITALGDGTITGALGALNSNLENTMHNVNVLGAITDINQPLYFKWGDYRVIIFRVHISNSAYLYQSIPTPALQMNAYSEMCISEGSDGARFVFMFYAASSGMSITNVITNWGSWEITVIGVK